MEVQDLAKKTLQSEILGYTAGEGESGSLDIILGKEGTSNDVIGNVVASVWGGRSGGDRQRVRGG